MALDAGEEAGWAERSEQAIRPSRTLAVANESPEIVRRTRLELQVIHSTSKPFRELLPNPLNFPLCRLKFARALTLAMLTV